MPITHQTADRSWSDALMRGLLMRCPASGEGAMFARYLKVADYCPTCGEALHHHRADDAPPYFTIFIVGHIVIPLVLITERLWHPSLWLHGAIWLVVTLGLTLILMPMVKGGVVAFQWALKMHGFEYEAQDNAASKPLDSPERACS